MGVAPLGIEGCKGSMMAACARAPAIPAESLPTSPHACPLNVTAVVRAAERVRRRGPGLNVAASTPTLASYAS